MTCLNGIVHSHRKTEKVFFRENWRCSMCAPRVTRHTSIRYSSSCHTRVCGRSQDGTHSILTLLGNDHQILHENYQCRMYSRELLMMGREDVRNMQSFITE
jgi:hypothetical protein